MEKYILLTNLTLEDTLTLSKANHLFCYEKVGTATIKGKTYHVYESENFLSEDVNRRCCEQRCGKDVIVYRQVVEKTAYIGEFLK